MVRYEQRIDNNARFDVVMSDAAAEGELVPDLRRHADGNRLIDKPKARAHANVLPEHRRIIDQIDPLDRSDGNPVFRVRARYLFIFQIPLIDEFVCAGEIRVEPLFELRAHTPKDLPERVNENGVLLFVPVEFVLAGGLG